MKKIVLLGMVLLIMVAGMMGCNGSASEPTPGPTPESPPGPKVGLSIGNIAPNFQLEDLNGNLVSLWDLRGKMVLLNFWTLWCGYCKKEMPSMETIYRDYKDRGFEILAVNVEGDRDSVRVFMEQEGFTFPVLLDSSGMVAWTYQVSGYPITYIIDSQGVIRGVVPGAVDWAADVPRQAIEELLPAETDNGSEP